jgi:hypothetical protein
MRVKINPAEFLVDIVAAAVKKIRNRPKAVARRAQKAAKRSAKQASDEVSEEFNQPVEDVSMDAVVGAFKSKLVWLGFMQVVYGIFQLWATGDLSPETAGPVVSGALTIVLRAITTGSLAEKAK